MRAKELHLQNFRCFNEISINFDDRLTVLLADNGMGKTAILDGIALAFGRLLSKVPKVSGSSSKDSDIRVLKDERIAPFLRYTIRVTDFEGKYLSWSAGRTRDSSERTLKEIEKFVRPETRIGTREVDRYVESLVERDLNDEPYVMPVIAYYGTSRAVLNFGARPLNFKKTFSRLESLAGALSPDARFHSVFEWFRVKEDEERRAQVEKGDLAYRLPELQAVRQAIESMLPEFSNPRTKIRPLRFVVDRKVNEVTQVFTIGQLSDGYRTALAMVMDIARRMAQANPPYAAGHFGFSNPLEAPAIILIDEVDLHLHPRWQQRIIPDLLRTFPNAQFIVTTHSPQVVSTVPAKCVFLIRSEADSETGDLRYSVEPPPEQIQGVASSFVLASTMQTDPVPPIEESQWLARYRALIQQDLQENEEGLRLKERLIKHFGPMHPEILECERMIRLQGIKKKLPVSELQGQMNKEVP